MNYEQLLGFVSYNFHMRVNAPGNNMQSTLVCKEHGDVSTWGREVFIEERPSMLAIGRHMDSRPHKGYDGKPGPDDDDEDENEGLEPEEAEDNAAEGPQGQFAKRYIGLKDEMLTATTDQDPGFTILNHRLDGRSWTWIVDNTPDLPSYLSYEEAKKKVKKMYRKALREKNSKEAAQKELNYELSRTEVVKDGVPVTDSYGVSYYKLKHLYAGAYCQMSELVGRLKPTLECMAKSGNEADTIEAFFANVKQCNSDLLNSLDVFRKD